MHQAIIITCYFFPSADVVVGRSGIGYDGNSTGNSKSFVELISRYLRNYKKSDSVHNLVFSNEFSSDQRKHIHLQVTKKRHSKFKI